MDSLISAIIMGMAVLIGFTFYLILANPAEPLEPQQISVVNDYHSETIVMPDGSDEKTQVTSEVSLFLQSPLRIEGLDEIQHVGQKIEFTVKFNGAGYGCQYPKLKIENNEHRTVWESNDKVMLCDPETKTERIEKEWSLEKEHLGTPIINKTGFYTLFAEFENDIIQHDFWVNPQIKDVEISPEGPERDAYYPTVIKVKIGYNNTVKWTNHGKTSAKITADNATDLSFFEATNLDVSETSFLAPGKSFTFTFDREGTFGYHGQPWQRGSVIVLPPDDAVVQLQIQSPDTPEDKDYSIKAAARKGYSVIWYNIDNKTHTITSMADNGKSFDSGPIFPYATVFTLDTSSLKPGYYQYYDMMNPSLSDTLRIMDPAEFDDHTMIENAKKIIESEEFLRKYPEALTHVDHDYYDMVSFGVINETADKYRSIWMRIIFDESGNNQRAFIDCGHGGMTLEVPNVLEYLKAEKCLSN